MKKFKYALWVLLIGFLGVLIYQNQGFFLTQYSLDINLGFAQYHIPEVYCVVIIAVFFFAGMLIAYTASLFERYRARKTIQSLKKTMDSYSGTISSLKQEVEALKPQFKSVADQPEIATDPAVSSKTEAV
jgi:uncharacterized integral membrane protein